MTARRFMSSKNVFSLILTILILFLLYSFSLFVVSLQNGVQFFGQVSDQVGASINQLQNSVIPSAVFHHQMTEQEREAKSSSYETALADKYTYNLIGNEEPFLKMAQEHAECTEDYMNANKLAQDHPCVINIIRRHYLVPPSPRDSPYNLNNLNHTTQDLSQIGAPTRILGLLKNKTGGFVMECGALDGDWLSNTLYLEHTMKWNGLLVEPNPAPYKDMMKKNRKMWKAPVCLSLKPYPTVANLANLGDSWPPGLKIIRFVPEGNDDLKRSFENTTTSVQCFPIYSLLLALNQVRVDFFSLDIDGYELEVLKTIPFRKVDIRTWAIETGPMPKGKGELYEEFSRFMSDSGYLRVGDLNNGQVLSSVTPP